MLEATLSEWNPWWKQGAVPDELKGRPRPKTTGGLMGSIEQKEITVLTGVRRAGKSTLMFQMIDDLLGKGIKPENILFVNMDDENLAKVGLSDIESAHVQAAAPKGRRYVFYDEVHGKSGWERWLKTQYDLKKDVKYVVTGSSSSLLKGEYSTLLTGRNLTFDIYPFSFREYLDFCDIDVPEHPFTKDDGDLMVHQLARYMEFGGFPEVHTREGEMTKRNLLKQYFHDIIYRDIVFRYNVNGRKVTDLAVHLMTNIANPFTMRGLRGATGLSYDVIRDYLAYFEDAYLFRIVPYHSYSSKPLVAEQRPRKMYCIDTGLRNAVVSGHTKDTGHLAENVVACELHKRSSVVNYWKGRNEVDFIFTDGSKKMNAMNVSYTDDVPEREVEGMVEFRETFGNKVNDCVILTRNVAKEENEISFQPLWKWLLG